MIISDLEARASTIRINWREKATYKTGGQGPVHRLATRAKAVDERSKRNMEKKRKLVLIIVPSFIVLLALGVVVGKYVREELPDSIFDLPISSAVGSRLPNSVTEVKHKQLDVFGVHHIYIRAKMPREDYLILVNQLGLKQPPDLTELDQRLKAPVEPDISGWWTCSGVPNNDTCLRDGTDNHHQFSIVMTYEDGYMFLVRTDD